MGVFKEALESLKMVQADTTDEALVKLSEEEYEAFKQLVWMARAVHRHMQKRGGTKRVLRGLDLARESRKADQEAGDDYPSVLSE